METPLKANLANKDTWIRFVYMILFAVVFSVAEIVASVVVAVQFLFKLFTGEVNEPLRDFGYRLAVYFQEIVAFLTYHTEQKPYPFAPWPAAAPEFEPAAAAFPEPGPEPEPEPPAAAQPAPSRKPRAPRKRRAKPKAETPPEEEPEG